MRAAPPASNRVNECFAALDRAIAITARHEFERLTAGLSDVQKAKKIIGALKNLKALQSPAGRPPSYDDPWIPLLYVLWYQPGQTYLAFRILRELASKRRPETLRVIDIGCGALALELAVDISLASGVFSTNGVPYEAVVYSHDPSSPMVSLGEKISEALLEDQDFPLRSASLASDRVLVQHDFASIPEVTIDEEWWVTAIHAVYRSNLPEIRGHLNEITRRVRPVWFVLTTHSSKQDLLPKPKSAGVLAPVDLSLKSSIVEHRFFPELSHVAEFRQQLREIVERAKSPPTDTEDARMAMSYLARAPQWFRSASEASCIAYERRK